MSMPRLSNKKALKSFLGADSYYKRYIPKQSEIVVPLTNLLKEQAKFLWTNEAKNSFKLLKHMLASKPVLYIADYSEPFVLFVDASYCAVSAVLSQCDESNLYRSVCYMSRKLNECQCNYSLIEKELLAIVLAVRQFSNYLSFDTVVYSDHEPLAYMNKLTGRNCKLLRWSLELAPYNLKVKHIKGKNISFADFLSRPGLYTE
jgi:hypothetical protein